VLLLAPRVRDAVRGSAVEAVVIAAQLVPFVAFGDFRMFDYEWRVARGTLLSLAAPVGTHFGWPLRLLQAAIVCGIGAVFARRLRGTVHAVWLVPLSVAVVRILFDPLSYGWYWLEAEALMLAGAALVADRTLSSLVRGRAAASLAEPSSYGRALPFLRRSEVRYGHSGTVPTCHGSVSIAPQGAERGNGRDCP